MARPKVNPDSIEKVCPICNKTYQCVWQRRLKQKYCGKVCANADPAVKKKIVSSQEKTYGAKYGGHPMTTDAVKENFKAAMVKTHGVDHPAKMANHMVKVKRTNLDRHGAENYNNLDQIKATCLERFGVENVANSPEIAEQRSETKISNHYDNVVRFCTEHSITPMFTRNEYVGYHFTNEYNFKCNVCGHAFASSVYSYKHFMCPKCSPTGKNHIEAAIYDFISNLLPGTNIKSRDRTVLYGKELDFYIADKKFAIEHNGLYWHSETAGGVAPEYHVNKTKACAFHGIRLIHIFEDEWITSQEIVKSVISSMFNVYLRRMGARKCHIEEVTHEQATEFLNTNHLQGSDNAPIRYGLFEGSSLVSLMTFGKTRFSVNGGWEMYRFCNKLGYHVSGGASRLFNHFVQKHLPERIVSYCDRRYFTGELYQKLGFQFVDNTSIGYHYISPDFKVRFNRMTFMKHLLKDKLEKFDESLTEWQNMQSNGFDRIWDCGMLRFIWKPAVEDMRRSTTLHELRDS